MNPEEEERFRQLAFQTLLDGSRDATERQVEMTTLRKVCIRGIPNRPPHMRPLAYNLLLETLPAEKRSWRAAAKQDRERYHTLLESFMDDLQESPEPTDPPTERDALLQTISKDVDRFTSRLPLLRRRTAPSRRSPLHAPPADDVAGPPGNMSESSSSSGEDEFDESAARQGEEPSLDIPSKGKGKGKGKAKAKTVGYMQSRRALFSRLEALAVFEHQRQAEARRKASGLASSSGTSGASRSSTKATAPEPDSPTQPTLSPRITLSPEPDESPSAHSFSSIPPTGSSQSRSSSLQTPELSLSTADDVISASRKDPITLLSPRPIPAPGMAQISRISGSLLQAETHAECIIRLLYVFCQVHPQWSYKSHFVDIIVPLYLVYSGQNGKEPWAEEQTFWALAGIMSDLGSVISADEDGLQVALDRLGRRVKWADYDLYDSLRARNLDPATPTFAYRWMTSLFTNTLPPPAVFPIWDFLFSEPPSTATNQPKLDLLVDLCVALLILLKPRLNHAGVVTRKKGGGLWGDDDTNGDEDSNSDAFVNGFNLLRNPPLHKIGGVDALLQTAYKVRQARMVAGLSGDDPDTVTSSSTASYISWAPSLPSLGQYAPSLPTTDSLASISKVSSGWTSAAKAKWWTTSQAATNNASTAATTASTSIGVVAGRLWNSMRGQDSVAEAAEFDYSDSRPSTPDRTPISPPPTFLEPKDTIRSTQPPAKIQARRDKHEAASALGAASSSSSSVKTSPVAGITEKLSNLASTFTGSPSVDKDGQSRPSSFGSPNAPGGPRPLLLSGSARRASNSSSTGTSGRFRDPSSGISLHDSPPAGTLSPPISASSGRMHSGRRRESSETSEFEGGALDTLKAGAFLSALGGRRVFNSSILRSLPRPFVMAPMLALAGLATSARMFKTAQSSQTPTPNYPDHVPLNRAQNALLAVGSGIMGVLDTSRGDLIATLSESTASTFLPSLHATMMAHPEGRQIMKDRPIVSSQTVNLDHLLSLRRGTLGREYVEWLQRSNLSPDSREKVRYIDSPTLAYTMLRYRQTHDLYHTVFSLPPTLVHELSLKVVELSNMSLPVAALSSTFGPLRLSPERRSLWYADWVPWALRTGRQGRSLAGVYWEKRWEQGLGELRQELGVKRNDMFGVESRWRGYRELREMERGLRRKGEWVDEPEDW